jgi:outer membrane protein TolC
MTRQTYVIGQESYLRLLQAQRQLMEVSLDYVNAQEQRWTAAAAVAGLLQAEQFP